jgi:ABC-type sugar transport system ATPase subunit
MLIINQAHSADRAFKVAKLTKTFNSIGTKRVLTKNEKNSFVKKFVGKDLARFKKELNHDRMELLEKASKLNGISPKNISNILNYLAK